VSLVILISGGHGDGVASVILALTSFSFLMVYIHMGKCSAAKLLEGNDGPDVSTITAFVRASVPVKEIWQAPVWVRHKSNVVL
jgi:hypothetical protein